MLFPSPNLGNIFRGKKREGKKAGGNSPAEQITALVFELSPLQFQSRIPLALFPVGLARVLFRRERYRHARTTRRLPFTVVSTVARGEIVAPRNDDELALLRHHSVPWIRLCATDSLSAKFAFPRRGRGKNGGKGKRIFGGNGGEWKKLVAKEEDRRKENGGRRALRAGLKRNFVDGLCDA